MEGRVLLPLLRREVTHGLYVGGIDTPRLVTIGFPTSPADARAPVWGPGRTRRRSWEENTISDNGRRLT